MTQGSNNIRRHELLFRRDEGDFIVMAALCRHSPNLPAAESVLCETEYRRYLDFPSEVRKRSYFLGRLTAKIALQPFLEPTTLKDIEISSGVFGFPIVTPPSHYNISISHVEGLALSLAYPISHPVSIDIELIQPTNHPILEYLTPLERQFIASGGEDTRMPTFFWCAKEAVSKNTKTGLTTPLEILEISSVTDMGSYCIVLYKNFSQYKSICFSAGNYAISLCFPKKSELTDVQIKRLKSDFINILTE